MEKDILKLNGNSSTIGRNFKETLSSGLSLSFYLTFIPFYFTVREPARKKAEKLKKKDTRERENTG